MRSELWFQSLKLCSDEVKSGDSLSKISKMHYGDAMKYNIIFEANKPMLKDVDLILPGSGFKNTCIERFNFSRFSIKRASFCKLFLFYRK